MKYLFVIGSLLALSFTGDARKFIPPGTVRITETFFADEYEISNLSWLEFEYWTMNKYGSGSPEHLAVLTDSSVWHDRENYSAVHANRYYRHKVFRNYPVTGVTHEQAEAFCRWRTDRVKEFYAIRYKRSIDISYRLPTEAEWEMIATPSSGVLNKGGLDSKGRPALNCLLNDTGDYGCATDVTVPVNSFKKNRFGIYNLLGNVAEMVSEPGIAKGGSWRHRPEECRTGKRLSYAKPSAWLGFRCVCDYTVR